MKLRNTQNSWGLENMTKVDLLKCSNIHVCIIYRLQIFLIQGLGMILIINYVSTWESLYTIKLT